MPRNAHPQQAPIALKDQEAIDLWLKGKDVWNKWVEKNPGAYIHFFQAGLARYRQECSEEVISFAGFNFPSGGSEL